LTLVSLAKDAEAYSAAYFGQGFGDIYLTDVECSGTETQLLSCQHSALST